LCGKYAVYQCGYTVRLPAAQLPLPRPTVRSRVKCINIVLTCVYDMAILESWIEFYIYLFCPARVYRKIYNNLDTFHRVRASVHNINVYVPIPVDSKITRVDHLRVWSRILRSELYNVLYYILIVVFPKPRLDSSEDPCYCYTTITPYSCASHIAYVEI